MKRVSYLTLEEHLATLSETNKDAATRLWHDHKELFETAQGSRSKHQAWLGGYRDHLTETMNLAASLYDSLVGVRSLPFELSDAILVLYLHDLEKPFKQAGTVPGLEQDGIKNQKQIDAFKREMVLKYEFNLTPEQENALQYVEGEGSAYTNDRVMGPLAAFVHVCDVLSARLWYDRPKKPKRTEEPSW